MVAFVCGMLSFVCKPATESLFGEQTEPELVTRRFSDVTRLRALEVLGDTDDWTGSDWQRAAILLASAIVAVAGDLDKVLE
jgi:hypothetical protein